METGITKLPWLSGFLDLLPGPGNEIGRIRVRRGKNARLRVARPGDRIRIEQGHALVAELLRAQGAPVSLRPRYPVLSVGEEIVWVPGVRSAPISAKEETWSARLEVDREKSWASFILARILDGQP